MKNKQLKEDSNGIFGRAAFPGKRTPESPLEPELENEPDTEEEKWAWHALERHVMDNIPMDAAPADYLSTAASSGQYNDVLQEPRPGTQVYRGMTVPGEWLRVALRLSDNDRLSDQGERTGAFTFTPRGGQSSSWSVSRDKAEQFADGTTADAPYAVVLTAVATPGLFLSGPDGFYKLKRLGTWFAEREVIGLGPILVMKISWCKILHWLKILNSHQICPVKFS